MTEASTQYIGRFAPSPTGPLHFGSLVACLASYVDARAHGGRWLLRIEDVDTTRCQPAIAADIIATLRAFGFTWDGAISYQHRHHARYQALLDRLADRQLTYACACSRREIADSGVSGIDGPVYPGTCRHRHLKAPGNAIRLLTNDVEICFEDRVQGRHCQRLETAVGDFVLKRRDGVYAYQLAVVADDAEQQVTHVVRGADLLDSTPRQIYLQRLLDLPTPCYLHIPVVVNPDGQKLSKQTLAPAITPEEAGKLLLAALAFLGQPAQPAGRGGAPAEILSAAVANWDPAGVPKRRTGYIS